MKLIRVSLHILLGWVLVLSGAGCGGGGGDGQSWDATEAAHIENVGKLCEEFKKEHNGKNPANVDELKGWAVEKGKAQDKDFVSTRDGQPYVFVVSSPKNASIMIHEAKGKNGRKFMLSGQGAMSREVDDASISATTFLSGGGKTSEMGKGVLEQKGKSPYK